jgi:anionic cell wall polymer biosynthesis LytR-Cps2A-Psr (LCP) family protein
VLLAIRDRMLRPDVLPRLPALILALRNAAQTDLAPDEIAALACVGPQIDRSAIQTYSIDGTMVWPWETPAGAQVSIPNLEVIAPVVEAFLSNGQ